MDKRLEIEMEKYSSLIEALKHETELNLGFGDETKRLAKAVREQYKIITNILKEMQK